MVYYKFFTLLILNNFAMSFRCLPYNFNLCYILTFFLSYKSPWPKLFNCKLYGKPLHSNWESSKWDFKSNTGIARQSNFPRTILTQNEIPPLTRKLVLWLVICLQDTVWIQKIMPLTMVLKFLQVVACLKVTWHKFGVKWLVDSGWRTSAKWTH